MCDRISKVQYCTVAHDCARVHHFRDMQAKPRTILQLVHSPATVQVCPRCTQLPLHRGGQLAVTFQPVLPIQVWVDAPIADLSLTSTSSCLFLSFSRQLLIYCPFADRQVYFVVYIAPPSSLGILASAGFCDIPLCCLSAPPSHHDQNLACDVD